MLLKDIDFTKPNVDEIVTPIIERLDTVLTSTTSDTFSPDSVISPVTEARESVDKQARDVIAKLGDELEKAQAYIAGQNDTIKSLTDKIVVRGNVEPVELEKSDVDKLIAGEVL